MTDQGLLLVCRSVIGVLTLIFLVILAVKHPSITTMIGRLDYGNVSNWLSALATVGALIFAGIAARAALDTNRNQASALVVQQHALEEQVRQYRTDREEQACRERSALARQVSVWIEPNGNNPVALYQNLSGQPVHRVSVGYYSTNNDNQYAHSTLPPTSSPAKLPNVTELIRSSMNTNPYLIYSFMFHYENEVTLKRLVPQPDGTQRWEEFGLAGPIGLTITFTDANGMRWHRGRDGKLINVEFDFNAVIGGVIA